VGQATDKRKSGAAEAAGSVAKGQRQRAQVRPRQLDVPPACDDRFQRKGCPWCYHDCIVDEPCTKELDHAGTCLSEPGRRWKTGTGRLTGAAALAATGNT
jgi:hypothetical protein